MSHVSLTLVVRWECGIHGLALLYIGIYLLYSLNHIPDLYHEDSFLASPESVLLSLFLTLLSRLPLNSAHIRWSNSSLEDSLSPLSISLLFSTKGFPCFCCIVPVVNMLMLWLCSTFTALHSRHHCCQIQSDNFSSADNGECSFGFCAQVIEYANSLECYCLCNYEEIRVIKWWKLLMAIHLQSYSWLLVWKL